MTKPHDSQTIQATHAPPSVEAARRLLTALTDPAHDDDVALTAVEALATLNDVTPPYPPVQPPLPTVEADATDAAFQEVLRHLEAALDEVTHIRDLTRIGLTALTLRHRGHNPTPPTGPTP